MVVLWKEKVDSGVAVVFIGNPDAGVGPEPDVKALPLPLPLPPQQQLDLKRSKVELSSLRATVGVFVEFSIV